MNKPVKLSTKKSSPKSEIVYYTVAIPKELGERFPPGTWFSPELTDRGDILLRYVRS